MKPENRLELQVEKLRQNIQNKEICTCRTRYGYVAGRYTEFEPTTKLKDCKVCNPENNNE